MLPELSILRMSLMSGEHVILCRGAERAIWHSSPERFCKFYKFRTDKSGFSSPSAHGGLGEGVRQNKPGKSVLTCALKRGTLSGFHGCCPDYWKGKIPSFC